MILERIGKAIKKPAKNTLVSFAASEIGTGKGFAYQEFLDQLGAFLGPVLLFVTALVKGTDDLFTTYRISFALLLVPAMITITLVLTAKIRYPDPEIFEVLEFDYDTLLTRLREQAFLNAGIRIILKDLRADDEGKTKEEAIQQAVENLQELEENLIILDGEEQKGGLFKSKKVEIEVIEKREVITKMIF